MFIYLHGFASSSKGHKAQVLPGMLPGYRFLALDYEAHLIERALPRLIEQVNDHASGLPPEEPLVLIGSSMGGFYARLLAHEIPRVDHVVMINPALTPSRTLQRAIGENRHYQRDETFTVTAEDVAAYAAYEAWEVPETTGLTVLLDEADEVIPYREALERYGERGKVVVYPGGSHGFEHLEEALEHLRAAHEKRAHRSD